jgi:2-oxo-4-hydroxy-4-carboxy--5-ureidoimidazoline (OHCU) decarboxylase
MSTSSPHLPSLSAIHNEIDSLSESSPLIHALSLLFEPSSVLTSTIAPSVYIALSGTPVLSYSALVKLTISSVYKLPPPERAAFIAAHPRIGEVRALSALSASEQARHATPPSVLMRLAHLNACYERVFPGLVFITFVAGRSRAAVAEEMEDKLGFAHSLDADEPPLETLVPVRVEGDTWMAELDRAVEDVGRIALNRLEALGAQ